MRRDRRLNECRRPGASRADDDHDYEKDSINDEETEQWRFYQRRLRAPKPITRSTDASVASRKSRGCISKAASTFNLLSYLISCSCA